MTIEAKPGMAAVPLGENVVRYQPVASARTLSESAKITDDTTLDSSFQTHRMAEDMDKDVRRLEDRIDAVNREGQLRLDVAMARIEGHIARIGEQTTAIRQEMAEQRQDARALRTEVAADISASVIVTRSWGAWIIGTVVALAVAGVTIDIGLRQVWIGGVQIGQSSQALTAGSGAPAAKSKPPS